MRLIRPGFIAGIIYPEAIFRIDNAEKMLCLTFDDGPDPDSTPELLSILDKHKIRSIFFCTGAAAEKYPGLMDSIRSAGHITGNHGYLHMDGWKTPASRYLENIEKADRLTSDMFFRPPYGRMTMSQYSRLKSKYRIMMWDVMAYDFDKCVGAEKSLGILRRYMRPGSVVVLHDKADSAARTLLEEFILYADSLGYKFTIPFP